MNYKSMIVAAGLVAVCAGCATFEETLEQANGGNSSAQLKVAEVYANGSEVPKDLSKAEEYYKMAVAGGNKEAERALILFYMGNGMTEHWDDIAEKIVDVSDGSMWHYGLDNEMLKKAPLFSRALVNKGDFSKRKAFDETMIKIAKHQFQGFLKGGGVSSFGFNDLPEIVEYRKAIALVSELEAQIVSEKNTQMRQKREEEERIAKIKAEAERKAHEEKAEAERKARAEKERLAYERAEQEWGAKKDDTTFKYPCHDNYPDSISVYKEIKTGVSVDWTKQYLEHSGFSNIHGKPAEGDAYISSTNIVAVDGKRTLYLLFAALETDGASVLIKGEINFGNGDVSHEALVERYKKDYPKAKLSTVENTIQKGGGMIFGQSIPLLTFKTAESTFSNNNAIVTVFSFKSVTLDLNNHHIDEDGNYSGPANDAVKNVLVYGTAGRNGAELAAEMKEAIDKWKKAKELCCPAVVIVDVPMRDAANAIADQVKRNAEEKAKREAEEAAKLRREEEQKNANDF